MTFVHVQPRAYAMLYTSACIRVRDKGAMQVLRNAPWVGGCIFGSAQTNVTKMYLQRY